MSRKRDLHYFETQTRIPAGDKTPAVTFLGILGGRRSLNRERGGERENETEKKSKTSQEPHQPTDHVWYIIYNMSVCALCARVVMRVLSGLRGRVYNPSPRITDKTWQRAAGDKLLGCGIDWRRRPRRTSLFTRLNFEGDKACVSVFPSTGWFNP